MEIAAAIWFIGIFYAIKVLFEIRFRNDEVKTRNRFAEERLRMDQESNEISRRIREDTTRMTSAVNKQADAFTEAVKRNVQ